VVAEGVGLAVLVGWLVGVGVGVGELLAVADGLDVAWLDAVGDGWLGVGEGWLAAGDGVAVAEAVGAGEGVSVPGTGVAVLATAVPGPADEAAVAIMIPATSATTPPTAPAASNSRVQEDIGSVPCPSPANGAAFLGLDWHRRHPFRRPAAARAAASPARVPGSPALSPWAVARSAATLVMARSAADAGARLVSRAVFGGDAP
jgi:hypothetical protein